MNEPRPSHPTGPKHPTGKAIVFIIVVTVAVVGLAMLSTVGQP